LFDNNHENIGLFSPPIENTSAIEDRVEGFIQGYAERGMIVNKDLWMIDLHSTVPFPDNMNEKIKQDIDLIKDHLRGHPEISAVFAMEYNIAVLVKIAAEELALSVPDNLSIICFDTPRSFLGKNQFTHIKQDVGAMASHSITAFRGFN
jgi:GntR family transcriptional regulator, arabinose operon transcriptional repressor